MNPHIDIAQTARRAAPFLVPVALLAVLSLLVVLVEIRTNAVAHWLGDYLIRTNAQRPAVGTVWEELSGREQAQQSLGDTLSVSLAPGTSDLPPAVLTHDFELDRIPEDGLPNYVALTVHPPGAVSAPGSDAVRLARARRIYRVGSALLAKAQSDAAPYAGRIEQRTAELVRDLPSTPDAPGSEPVAPDTGDSVRATTADPESLRVEVVAAVRSVVTEDVLASARQDLQDHFRDGIVHQLFLTRGLARFEGEVFFTGPNRPSVRFALAPSDVAAAFGVALPGPDTLGVAP